MAYFSENYPSFTSLFSIGQSVRGREIWCLKIAGDLFFFVFCFFLFFVFFCFFFVFCFVFLFLFFIFILFILLIFLDFYCFYLFCFLGQSTP